MTYRLVDGLGSTVNLCDGEGNLIGEYAYDAHGNVRSQSGAETEFSFAGEQSDPNGLDFLRARYYDPEIGRFLSGDPLGGGYGYAAGNPVNLTDPSGMVPAGTCLTMNNAAHVLVPCGGGDLQALKGDRWYSDYLSQSLSNGVSDHEVLQALWEEVFVSDKAPSDTVFQAAVGQAIRPPRVGEHPHAGADYYGLGYALSDQESPNRPFYGCAIHYMLRGPDLPSPAEVLDAALDAYGSECGTAVAHWVTGEAAVESIHAVYWKYTPHGNVLVIEFADETGGYTEVIDDCF